MTGRFLFIRDLQVAEDIGARAKLGWFDKEFNFWGTAYFRNKEERYLISGNPDRIYDFVEDCFSENVYCAPVQSFTRKCPVPSGTEELIAQDFKVLLGKQLQKKYPASFLQEFQDAFCDIANNTASGELEKWKVMLDGLFDAEQLYLFELLLQAAYAAKRLKPESYHEFQQWLQDVYADMGDDLIVKDVYRRDFYSLSYAEKGIRKYIINAQKSRLYAKKEDLGDSGLFCTPIHKKTYWYNHDYRLADARKEYEAYLKSDRMHYFFESIDRLNALESPITNEMYQNYSARWMQQYGDGIQDYLEYYQKRWHCQS